MSVFGDWKNLEKLVSGENLMEVQASEIREKIRQQFEATPYPNHSLDESPKHKLNLLYVYNLATPFYLRNQQVIETKGKLILDAGCGSGYTSLALAEANPDAQIFGIDLSAESVKLARQRLQYHGFDNAEFYTLSIEDLSSLGMEFDYINCDETLYLLPDPIAGLEAMKSVLKPQGLIHTNLHSSRQRFYYYQAQELFKMMGLLEEAPQKAEVELVRDIMRALKDNVVLKKQAWDDVFDQTPELALLNHLLQGDKGYTIQEMFAALKAADLEFISMVEWRKWELLDLFKNLDDLPAFLALSLPELSVEEQLHVFELLHPTHRLLDFWCGHPDQNLQQKPVAEWTQTDWLTSCVHLHPQLRSPEIKTDLLSCVSEGKSWSISNYINLPVAVPLEIDSAIATCLLPLWEQAQPFTTLVKSWQKIRPTDGSYETACNEIQSLLSKLEVSLYVLLSGDGYKL
jgi:2-polyprenyl-3-methyl-5-hydroxy-6-metoxy-1,4-benzoquinol methylase